MANTINTIKIDFTDPEIRLVELYNAKSQMQSSWATPYVAAVTSPVGFFSKKIKPGFCYFLVDILDF